MAQTYYINTCLAVNMNNAIYTIVHPKMYLEHYYEE